MGSQRTEKIVIIFSFNVSGYGWDVMREIFNPSWYANL
jgi:hypothetical protein